MHNDENTRLVLQATENLDLAARTFVNMSDQIARGALTVAAAREPTMYGGVAEAVRTGRLLLQVTVSRGLVTVNLVDVATDGVAAVIYQYSAPGSARGRTEIAPC